jgi:hypothetical protein
MDDREEPNGRATGTARFTRQHKWRPLLEYDGQAAVDLPQPHPFRRGADPAAGGRDRGIDVDQPRATRRRYRNAWMAVLAGTLLRSTEADAAANNQTGAWRRWAWTAER